MEPAGTEPAETLAETEPAEPDQAETLAEAELAETAPAETEPAGTDQAETELAGTEVADAGAASFVVRPGSPVGIIPPGAMTPARPRPAYPADDTPPSWPRVIWNTVWLPVRRRIRRLRRRVAAHRSRWLVAVVVIAVLLAGVVITVFTLVSGSGPAARPAPGSSPAGRNGASGNGGQAIATARAARAAAAAWVAAEVGPAAVVACDPVTCGMLHSAGVPASNVLQLGPTAADPLGSVVVVATPALRGQLGTRLATVYAPVVLATFGTGADQVQVRVTALNGGAAYLSALRADVRARTTTGAHLLDNQNVTVAAAARQQLAAGQVDSRMLIMLSGLAYQEPVRITGFSDSGPGASAGVPFRQAELATPRTGPAAQQALNSMLNFIRAQQAPYRAAHASLVKLASGQSVVRIVFAAPSPLGLLPAPQAVQ